LRSSEVPVNDGDDTRLHLGGHVAVAQSDGAAVNIPPPAAVAAHQLVDDAGGDAAVF
jgi:hypothetical protein